MSLFDEFWLFAETIEPSNIDGRNSRKYVVVHINNNKTVTKLEKSKIADIIAF